MTALTESVAKSSPRYTVTKIYAQTEKPYGTVHAADNDQTTRCGLTIDRNWYILTNRIGDGNATCLKCRLNAEVSDLLESPMTIADVIAHLQTMPPNMEVWVTWDESGEYWPATKPQGRVDWVQQMTRRGKLRWEESWESGKGKAVCVLLSNEKLTDGRG